MSEATKTRTPMEIYLAGQKAAPSAPLKSTAPAKTSGQVGQAARPETPAPDYKAEYDSLLGQAAATDAALKAMQARHADEIKDLAKQHADQQAALKKLETIHAQQLSLAAGTFKCNW